jgi:hypothetical protein
MPSNSASDNAKVVSPSPEGAYGATPPQVWNSGLMVIRPAAGQLFPTATRTQEAN